jgi:hypothetical protein
MHVLNFSCFSRHANFPFSIALKVRNHTNGFHDQIGRFHDKIGRFHGQIGRFHDQVGRPAIKPVAFVVKTGGFGMNPKLSMISQKQLERTTVIRFQ